MMIIIVILKLSILVCSHSLLTSQKSFYAKFKQRLAAAYRPLYSLETSELIKRINSQLKLDTDLESKIRNVKINGLILTSLNLKYLESLSVFSTSEILQILEVKKILRVLDANQEAEEISKLELRKAEDLKVLERREAQEFKLARAREIFITTAESSIPYTRSIVFTTQSAFKKFLIDNSLKSLQKVGLDLEFKEIVEYEYLENNHSYIGLSLTVSEQKINPITEIENILKAVRSKADFTAARDLSSKFGYEVTFVQNDLKLFKKGNSGDELGDVDSLFTSLTTDFILERKRTVGEDILEQLSNTKKAYEERLRQVGSTNKVESVLYAESINENIAQKLLGSGIHVMQDAVTTRFAFDKHEAKCISFYKILKSLYSLSSK